MGVEAAVVPTNASIALDGDANGLYWNAQSSTLYIADDGNNRILHCSTDSWAGITTYANLPAASASGPGLGQLIPLRDGSSSSRVLATARLETSCRSRPATSTIIWPRSDRTASG